MLQTILEQFHFGDETITLCTPNKQELFYAYKKQFPQQVFPDTTQENLFPFWAKIWHSAIALCTFLVHNSHLIKDKQVLEIGAGLGLPGLLAAKFAKTVTISDRETEALGFVQASIAKNRFTNCFTRQLNWEQGLPGTHCDVLLLSDICYDKNQFGTLENMMQQFLDNQTCILLATPQRIISRPFFENWLPYFVENEEMEIFYDGESVPINIIRLQKQFP